MTLSIRHNFVSAKSDGVDLTLVQPSYWNASHVITMAAGTILGRDSSGAGAAQELPLSVTPAGDADFTTGLGYLKVPRGTTAQRPGAPVASMIRYNSTLGYFEGYDATAAWVPIGNVPGTPPIGSFMPFSGRVEPGGSYLFSNGQAISRTTYATYFAQVVFVFTTTITIASPGVVTKVAHGLQTGDPVKWATTGALPTGLTAGTTYFAKRLTADTFKVSVLPNGADINTSGSQSGTHTLTSAPWGDGDGSTTFNVPDVRGRTVIGHDAMGAAISSRLVGSAQGVYGISLGYGGGEENHALTANENGPHSHAVGVIVAGNDIGSAVGYSVVNSVTGVSGLGTAHNNVQPGIVAMMIVRVL